MLIRNYQPPPHNAHYEGAYSESEMLWRRLCAIEKVNNIQSLIGDLRPRTVLEVGCGTGAVLAELASRGIGTEHVGVDMADPNMHKDNSATTLTLLQYDGKNIPFPDRSFEFVYASHVVEHVPEPRTFIEELARVSRDTIYIEVPCEINLRANFSRVQRSLNIGHINSYTPESFQLLLETSGLTVLNSRSFDHTLDTHSFNCSRPMAILKKSIRQSMLSMNQSIATKLATYHCGAIAKVTAPAQGTTRA